MIPQKSQPVNTQQAGTGDTCKFHVLTRSPLDASDVTVQRFKLTTLFVHCVGHLTLATALTPQKFLLITRLYQLKQRLHEVLLALATVSLPVLQRVDKVAHSHASVGTTARNNRMSATVCGNVHTMHTSHVFTHTANT